MQHIVIRKRTEELHAAVEAAASDEEIAKLARVANQASIPPIEYPSRNLHAALQNLQRWHLVWDSDAPGIRQEQRTIIIIITRFSCQEERCVLQKNCNYRLPQSYPLLDSPDPSKTQSTVGTVLSICNAPRQPGRQRMIQNYSIYTCQWVDGWGSGIA